MLNKPPTQEEALKRKRKREQEEEREGSAPVLEKKAHAVPASSMLAPTEAGVINSLSLAVINAKVRRHFSKAGLKSCNKMYVPDAKTEALRDDKLIKKHAARNHAVIAARPHMQLLRETCCKPGLTNLQVGRTVMNMVLPVGNCAEMSRAVLYLAHQQDIKPIWLCHIRAPGDHCFCIVTTGETPVFKSVTDFASDDSGAWVLDPWANIVCELKDYVAHFTMKMQIWTSQDKQVKFHPTAGMPGEWMAPSSIPYLYGFMWGVLRIEK